MIDNVLQGINLADMDGIKTIEVKVSDLQLLRREILAYRESNSRLVKDLHILDAKLGLVTLDSHVKLDVYM